MSKVVLLIGSGGQLGARLVDELLDNEYQVSVLIRSETNSSHLQGKNLRVFVGDIKDKASIDKAATGCDFVISTATVVFPKGRYSFNDDEIVGYKNLVEVCEKRKVSRLVFISILTEFRSEYIQHVPSLRAKKAIEELITISRTPYTILRSAPFMEDYFALVGSDLPLRGEVAPTLLRDFWFSKYTVGNSLESIEKKGLAMIPGRADMRHQFISISDVAKYMVLSLENEECVNRVLEVGGPEMQSWRDILNIFSEIHGRKVRAISTPAIIYRVLMFLLKPFSEAASNQAGLLWVLGNEESKVKDNEASKLLKVLPISSKEFLFSKLELVPDSVGEESI